VATVTNAIGESPASDSKSFTTLAAPAVPDAPTISSIDRLNKALDVKFTAGAENRAKVSLYTATCGNQSASNTSSPVKVEGLAVGTEYSCTVVATNSEGNSVASAVMKQTTMPIPPAPTIRLIQPAIDSVKVIFSTVTDGAGSELDYTANCDGITNTGKKSPIQISGLNASTSYSCKVTATNLAGTSPDSTLVSVTTKAAGSANAAPVVQDLSYSTSPNTALNNQLFNGTDADSDTLVYEIVTPPTKGTVKLNDNANGFTYDPSWSSSSDVVTDTFTFKANDGIDDSNSATVTITIENKVPVASNATFDTYKNAKISGQVSATDVEGDNFSYEKLSEPSNGTLTLTSYNGNFTYTPTDGFNGTDTFTFKAVEGYGNSARDSNTATVTINVSANTLTYSLTAGWNLVGFMPELYGTYGLPSEFRDSQNVDLMWQYDYGRSDWDGYSPDWSQNNTFDQNEKVENVEDYEGIWFKAKKDFSVTFDEVPSSNNSLSTITYQTGWNLVSSPDGEVLDPATDLPHNEAVWLYRGGNWLFYSSDAATAQSASNDSYGTFTAIQPNEAVWVHKP
jgi:hypothetical protein